MENEWQSIDNWHEDYGDCLFMIFSKDKEWIEGLYTSPFCSDWPEYLNEENILIFKRVSCLSVDVDALLSPPKDKDNG